jgi:outer membrane protein
MSARWLSLFSIASLALLGSAQAAPRKLTIDEALKMALENNPRVRAARSRAEAAHNQADSVRGRYLPSINLNDEWQHYNSPFDASFAIGPIAGHLPIRQINTNAFAVSANQPLLGLLEISQNHLAAVDQAGAADQQAKASEAGLREELQTLFLRLFEARATKDIAKTSQEQLGEQLTVAQSKLAAGVLTNADVLRVKVAVANARQQEIQAQAQEESSRAALLADLNLMQTDDSVDFEEPTALENAPPPPTLTDALSQADGHRPEIAGARLVQSAATHQGWGRLFHILPTVDFEAAYVNVAGQVLAEKESEYVGFKLTWNVWSWGADFYAQRAAAAQETAASIDTEGLRGQVGMDISSKLSVERASTVAVEVAQTAIASAEEAYRVTDALVKAGSATTTDLLDSQSALTQAKLNLIRARYQQAIARVSVKRAMGG